jgi:Flp pilus assembly protein TadG
VVRAHSGQAVAEFAIVAAPLLLLLLAILQFALIYNAQVGLTNAIRDAARYGSGLPVTTTAAAGPAASSTYSRLGAAMAANVAPFSASRLASATQVCFSAHDDGTGTTAAFVRVTAAYDHELVVPLVGAILDSIDGSTNGGFRITATTELRVDDPTQAAIVIPSSVCAP